METKEIIDVIQEDLRKGSLINDPHGCAEYVAKLSGELSFYLSMSSELEKNRPTKWLELRNSGIYKSDTSTDRAYTLTEDGIQLEWYESRIKRIKALLTGLKSLIRASEMEQMNLQ